MNDSDLWHIDDKEMDETIEKEPIFMGIPGKESTSTNSYAATIMNPSKQHDNSETWAQITKTGTKNKAPVPLTIPDTESPFKNENQFQGFQDFIETDKMISYDVSTDISSEQKSQKDEMKVIDIYLLPTLVFGSQPTKKCR
jgi:predicted AlkP superfamily phosphohydrolase/phosphomutase